MLEERIQKAYHESATGIRKGDTHDEMETIREYISGAKKIVVPNHSEEKVSVINEVLAEFGLCQAALVLFHTDCCDLSRMPALNKAQMALDITDGDLVIARGRLGVPGSGSMLVILDRKGRILSAALSPSHMIHKKPITEAVRDEMTIALTRVGFKKSHHDRH